MAVAAPRLRSIGRRRRNLLLPKQAMDARGDLPAARQQRRSVAGMQQRHSVLGVGTPPVQPGAGQAVAEALRRECGRTQAPAIRRVHAVRWTT